MKIINVGFDYTSANELEYRMIMEMGTNIESSVEICNSLLNDSFSPASFVFVKKGTEDIYGGLLFNNDHISESEMWDNVPSEEKPFFANYSMTFLKIMVICNRPYFVLQSIQRNFFDILSKGKWSANNQLVWFIAEDAKQALSISIKYPNVKWFKNTLLLYTNVNNIEDLNFFSEFKNI